VVVILAVIVSNHVLYNVALAEDMIKPIQCMPCIYLQNSKTICCA